MIDRTKTRRDDFKHNFLITGIIRLDYSGVINIEDIILKDLAVDLRKNGYTEYEEGYISELSFRTYAVE